MKNAVKNINQLSHTGYFGTSFLATFDTSPVTPGNPIVFNYPLVNAGGHYDSTTGIYTVPIDGTYEIIVHLWSYNDVNLGVDLTVDGSNVSTPFQSKIIAWLKLFVGGIQSSRMDTIRNLNFEEPFTCISQVKIVTK